MRDYILQSAYKYVNFAYLRLTWIFIFDHDSIIMH